jgi:hypothetical protein
MGTVVTWRLEFVQAWCIVLASICGYVRIASEVMMYCFWNRVRYVMSVCTCGSCETCFSSWTANIAVLHCYFWLHTMICVYVFTLF